MGTVTYEHRRGQLETYFDRTAAEAWSRLTSDAPVSRIRATVRAGRDRMRAALLGWLPDDLPAFRSDDPAEVATARQTAAEGRRGLLHLTGAPALWGDVGNAGCSIPRKVGAFWMPSRIS